MTSSDFEQCQYFQRHGASRRLSETADRARMTMSLYFGFWFLDFRNKIKTNMLVRHYH